MKKCNTCGLLKSLGDFPNRKSNKDGLDGHCRDCARNKRRTYRKQTGFYRKNQHTLARRFLVCKAQAKRRGCSFGLSRQDFEELTTRECSYCGGFSSGGAFTGIDQIDPSGGYIICNCAPCCDTCNFMKHTLSHETFLAQVQRIAVRCVDWVES